MPAKSKSQYRYIKAKRSEYGSKENTPDEDKWVWEADWTENVDYDGLPDKSAHEKVASTFFKMAWERAGDALQEITGGKPYPVSYATGEAKELGEELLKMRPSGIREESSDLAYALNMLGHQATGLNHPMIGGQYALNKFRARNKIWQDAMESKGVPFSVDYLEGGSNYHKPHKIQAAFAAAGHELSDEEAEALSQEMIAQESAGNEKRASGALAAVAKGVFRTAEQGGRNNSWIPGMALSAAPAALLLGGLQKWTDDRNPVEGLNTKRKERIKRTLATGGMGGILGALGYALYRNSQE